MMRTQFLDRPDGKIAYDDSGGEGLPVIMMPGMGALRSEYRFLAPAVHDAGFRAVTVDLRGHGESSAFWPEYSLRAVGEDLLAFIDHLGAAPAHVIGTSFSPGAMVWATAERPEAIRSLVLISAFVRDPQPTLVQRMLTALLLNGPWKVSGWIMYYKTLYPGRKPDDFDQYLGQLRLNLKEPGRFDALKQTGFGSKKDSESRLSEVNAPALVIMGSRDPDWPDPEVEAGYIADALSAELFMVEGAGHYPQTEMPEVVSPRIVDFLSRHSPTNQSPNSGR